MIYLKELDILIEHSLKQNYLTAFITIRFKRWFNKEFENLEEDIIFLELENKNIINILNKIPLNEYTIKTIELGKNKKPHHHIIVSCKNILGYNSEFIYNLKNYLIKELDEWDIIVDLLSNFNEYKNRFVYLFKENQDIEIIFYNEKLFNYFDKIIKDDNISITKYEKYIDNFSHLGSYTKIDFEYNEYTLINLINFYFSYKNLYLNKNIIYKKIENTLISYTKFINLEELPNFLINIFQELILKFEIQLKNIDIYMLKIKYFYKIEQLVEKTDQFIMNNIILKFDIIEFKDGIYILSQNKFIKRDLILEKYTINVGTLKYYEKTYKHLKLPTEWKNLIEDTLKNKKECQKLFEYFASLFNKNDNLLGKKRIMFIKGKPSTGKTTLLTKIIYNFFGEENIGTISGNSNFSLESLLQKELAVLDEAEHIKINKGFLLKITELNNPQSIDRKYKKAAILKSLRIIFLSNNEIKIKDNLVKEAFEKRIQMFEFTKQLPDDVENYKKIINMIVREEINIIIYCNKLFFKEHIYKEEKKPKIRSLKLIQNLLENIKENN